MKSSRRGKALRRLLDLCDDLQRIRTRMTDPALRRDARARLRRQARTKTDQLARDLASYRFKGPLGAVMRSFRLQPVHFQVLATLLHRHLRSETQGVEGREILASLFENSFEILAGMELLHENAPLRASGLVLLADDEDCPDDVLEARFRISEDAMVTFQEEIAGLVVADQRSRALEGYASNRDYLVDLHLLHNLYKHRSERVFQADRWDRIHGASVTPGGSLSRRITSFSTRIASRLRHTENVDTFPAVRFFRDLALDELEIVVVTHLLFRELYEGNAYADAAELMRLVSDSEQDLIRNRRLFQPRETLIAQEIVHVEPMLEGRELTGEVHLEDWAVNRLFGAGGEADGSIASDERLDWHLYLKNLGDARTFYRDLESNS